jgi:predicted alpha/beta superfamily hydrolase
MKLLLSIVFFAIFTSIYSQSENIIIGRTDSIFSTQLNEYRSILVHIPQDKPDDFSPNQKYPVVYVFDGDIGFFLSVVTVTELLGGGGGNYMFPKMMVVGVVNTDRTRDLTPTHASSGAIGLPDFLLETSGGGEKFANFLEKELIPHIDSSYPAAPYRVIIGHSLGGLTAINLLLKHRHMFNSYIAIDPSMHWDDQKLLKQSQSILKENFKNITLYLAISNTLGKGNTLKTVMKDRSEQTLPIRSELEFMDILHQNTTNNLNFKSRYYNDYDHGSIPLVAIYDALPFIFNFYPINFPFGEFFNPGYKNDSILIDHYKDVSKRMNYEVKAPGEFVDAVAHQLLDSKQYDRAYKFYKLNIENYAESYKSYNSMGDFYKAKGDSTTAVKYYNKALSLKSYSLNDR